MGQNITVRWKKDNVPPQEVVQQILVDYLGEDSGCKIDEGENGDWLVSLPGLPSHPMRSIHHGLQVTLQAERWFEVSLLLFDREYDTWGRGITITHRSQDAFVQAVIEGFVQTLKTYYKARINRGR